MKIVEMKTALIGREVILRVVTDAGIDVGSKVRVKYMGLDKKGRMDFSIKDAISE